MQSVKYLSHIPTRTEFSKKIFSFKEIHIVQQQNQTKKLEGEVFLDFKEAKILFLQVVSLILIQICVFL
jgi:hypothetical protein